MAQAIGDFAPPPNPAESELYSFDFVNDLTPGDSIVASPAPVWACAVVAGTDPDPASRLVGDPTTFGTTTTQRGAGFLPGVRYVLSATVKTAMGNTLVLWAYLYCEPVGC